MPIPNLARRAEESEVWQEVKEAQDGEGGSPPEAAVHEAHLEDDGSGESKGRTLSTSQGRLAMLWGLIAVMAGT